MTPLESINQWSAKAAAKGRCPGCGRAASTRPGAILCPKAVERGCRKKYLQKHAQGRKKTTELKQVVARAAVNGGIRLTLSCRHSEWMTVAAATRVGARRRCRSCLLTPRPA